MDEKQKIKLGREIIKAIRSIFPQSKATSPDKSHKILEKVSLENGHSVRLRKCRTGNIRLELWKTSMLWTFSLQGITKDNGIIKCFLNKPRDNDDANVGVYEKFGITKNSRWLFCEDCSKREFILKYIELLQKIMERHSKLYTKIIKKYEKDVDYFAIEGNIKLYTHLKVERAKKIISRKKEDVLAKTGKLECEACGFDFSEIYGGILKGEHFCEVHHRKPLGLRKKKIKIVTGISSLAILCSNCHRMIHKTRSSTEINQILTVEEFKELLTSSNFMEN